MLYVPFKQAIRSISSNIGRTLLTTLGIVIGVSTVIMVLSAGAGFRGLVSAQVDEFGSNTLFVETRVPPTTKNRNASAATTDFDRAGQSVAITSFKVRDLDQIKLLPNVSNVYGMVTGLKVVSYGDTEKSIIVYGCSADRFKVDKGTLKYGRFYTAADDVGASQVAILGSKLAEDLYGSENPVGKLVRVGTLNFQVIGVYNSRGSFGGMDNDNSVFIPLGTAQKKLLGIDYLIVGIVQVADVNASEQTGEMIRQLMRRNHDINDPAKDDFIVMTQAETMKTFDTIFGGITALLIAIASISLLVGGVGIMNIMYVIVTERTSEIGLKKALGAEYHDILGEFLMEAVLVTLLGGGIGILFGGFLGWAVAAIANASGLTWPFLVPGYAVAIGFGVSAAIGIGFGVLPARSAAKLDPIEALRYE